MVDAAKELEQIFNLLEAGGIVGLDPREMMAEAFEQLAQEQTMAEEPDLVEYENGVVLPAKCWYILEGESIDRPMGPFVSSEAAHAYYQEWNHGRKIPSPYLGAPRIETLYRPATGIVPRTVLKHVGYVHDTKGVLVSVEQWEAGEVPPELDGPYWDPVYAKVLPETSTDDSTIVY